MHIIVLKVSPLIWMACRGQFICYYWSATQLSMDGAEKSFKCWTVFSRRMWFICPVLLSSFVLRSDGKRGLLREAGVFSDFRSLILWNKYSFILSLVLPLFQLLRWACCISETQITKHSPDCPGERFGRSVRADTSPGGCLGYVCWRKWVTAYCQGIPEVWELQVMLFELSQIHQSFILDSLQAFM